VIYHYPKTARPSARDAGEVQATKNAITHKLPVFVVLPGKKSKAKRSVRLGWVSDFDDENAQFLILFGDEKPARYETAEAPNEPFQLITKQNKQSANVLVRKGQQRFRFQVMSQYGYKCAVCNIRLPELLKAAHICGIAEHGCDNWRNGLPLCATHHEAFDAHLFCIEPKSGTIKCKPGITHSEIGLQESSVKVLKHAPHVEALKWRWGTTQKQWNDISLKLAADA
jgi:putative restriction endonuclease